MGISSTRNYKNFAKIISYSAISLVSLAFVVVLIFTIYAAKYDCNIHGQKIFMSPSGDWKAVWSTEGCTDFSVVGDIVNWNSEVVVSDTRSPTKHSYVVFKSNSPDFVSARWTNKHNLNIVLHDIAIIKLSKRHVPGISINYSVNRTVLNRIDGSIETAKEERENNRMPEDKTNKDYLAYLEKFRSWAKKYDQLPPP